MGENILVGNVEKDPNACRNQVTPLDIGETMRSLRLELEIYKEDNESLIKTKEEWK